MPFINSQETRASGRNGAHHLVMITWGELRGNANVWPGFLKRADLTEPQFQEGSYLDDCARAGNWNKVLEILRPENHLVDVNQCRPVSQSQSTVLHRAAENHAPQQVISALIKLGAFRSLRDGGGLTAYEIAQANKSADEVLDVLTPPPSPLDPELITSPDANLASAVDGWLEPLCGGDNPRAVLRYPPVAVLHEPPGQELWVQAPKISGGFRVRLCMDFIELLLGYRQFKDDNKVDVKTMGFKVTSRGVEEMTPQ